MEFAAAGTAAESAQEGKGKAEASGKAGLVGRVGGSRRRTPAGPAVSRRFALRTNFRHLRPMPTVLRVLGFRFYFYSHEPGEPPHVHVDKGGATAKVWLSPIALARQTGFRPPDIATILDLVREHQSTLTEAWNGHFG